VGYGTTLGVLVECPDCRRVLRDRVVFAWGYCWGKDGTGWFPDYEIGDLVRWGTLVGQQVPTWFVLGTHDANIGKPGLDVDVTDNDFGDWSACDSCGAEVSGCVVSIREDRITAARAVRPGEFGDAWAYQLNGDERFPVEDHPLSQLIDGPPGAVEPDRHLHLLGFYYARQGELEPDEDVAGIESYRNRCRVLGTPSEIDSADDDHEIWHDRVSGALYQYWRHHQRRASAAIEVPAIALSLTEVSREFVARCYPSITLPD
jgi:hypothetical protein